MTKILLVEDDKSLREIYGTRLLAENFDIVSAGDGEEALAMAIKEKPDLIISDVMMPKISGFDMLDILRSTTETRDIKVIMMTALSSDDQRIRGEQLGADKYLVKSQVGIEDVVVAVHQVLGDGGGAAVPAAAPAAPADASAPASDAATTDSSATPATPAADTAVPPVSGSAPGNDAAGPLPPQPSETTSPAPVVEPTPAAEESALPQPTAPFSSPRPANLGESVIHPLDATAATPSLDTTTPPAITGLSTPASEPAPLDASASPAPASVNSADISGPVAGGLGFDTPKTDDNAAPAVGEPTPSTDPAPVSPLEAPAPLDTTGGLTPPAEEKKDDSTVPPASPTTPAV